MSIASRSLQKSLPSLLLHQRAALDRYGIVRAFFLRQASTRPPPNNFASGVRTLLVARRTTVELSYAKPFFSTPGLPRATLRSWQGFRNFHSGRSTLQETNTKPPEPKLPGEGNRDVKDVDDLKAGSAQGPAHIPQFENYSKFFRQLALQLPHLTRPTRDDFLNAASGFWQRLRVRFKWLTIRSFSKYNADDISAFISWFIMSQTLWLFVGT